MLKNNKGITLIALIIILVVLTILATVTINVTQGNKVIDKTEDILYDYEDLQVAEKIKLEYMKQKELGNIETVEDKNKLLKQITGNDWCKFASLSEDGNYISIESKRGRRYKLYLSNGSVSTIKDEKEIVIDTQKCKIKIKATPENAYINIISKNTGNTAYGNGEVTLEDYKNSHITYTVSYEGYNSQTNTIILSGDETININLEIKKYNVKISAEDSSAEVVICDSYGNELKNGNGSQEIIVKYGDTISYTVRKEGYNEITGKIENITENKEIINIKLEKKKYTVKLNVLDINGEILTGVTRKVNGITITDSGILIEHGTQIAYSAEKEGYNTKNDVEMITSDKEITITLKKPCTIIINATPSDATIKINGTTRNSITLEEGDKLSYSVEKSGYETKAENDKVITKDETLNITLNKVWVLTINRTPSDAVVKINGIITNSLVVIEGSPISYSVEKTGYDTQSDTITINQDKTIPIDLKVSPFDVTINPTPSDATVTIKKSDGTQLASGTGTQIVTVEYGTSITWSVSRDHYVTQTGNINNITSNQNKDVTLVVKRVAFTPVTLKFTSNSNSTYKGLLNGGSATVSKYDLSGTDVDMGSFTIPASTINSSIQSNAQITKVTLYFSFKQDKDNTFLYTNKIKYRICTGSAEKQGWAETELSNKTNKTCTKALTNISRSDLNSGIIVYLKNYIEGTLTIKSTVSNMYVKIEGTVPEI